ncbi:hypothetical protein [Shinella kummerowiae]|uniref:hypothetical protein n=1 Tax=Shinella kummerowiae TaxID=417745 RepID=UPI0021B60333|nr:hypothetical protein [Shinella kummerowiae]MCT7666790.1 hypothetical protein [Shinella kummerowiae]
MTIGEDSEENDDVVSMPKGSQRILVSVSCVSVVWVVLAIWAALFVSCPPATACLGLNEWGDFLAGVFAPLAFVWLAIAVVLQSAELREQRKEFKHNRNVMKAQAEEARRQAAYIGTQIQIMEALEQDKAIQVHLAHLRQWCFRRWPPHQGGYLTHTAPSEDQAFFVELTYRLFVAAHDKSEEKADKWNRLMDVDLEDLLHLLERIKMITARENESSWAMQAFLAGSVADLAVRKVVDQLPRPPLEVTRRYSRLYPQDGATD